MAWAAIAAVLRDRYDLCGLAAARLAHGWSQKQAAEAWCRLWPGETMAQGTLSGWETWRPGSKKGRMPSLLTIDRLARLYEVSACDLVTGWGDYRPELSQDAFDGGYPRSVDRRSFLGVVAGAGVASALPGSIKANRVGSADVDQLRAQVLQLWHADEAQGGAAVYRAVVAQLGEVRGLLDRAAFGERIGHQLQVINGQLAELAGFTAYDGGDQATARAHFHEALTIAHVAEDEELAVYVMAQLANLAQRQGNGREVVELTQAAQRRARGFAPPRLVSVLAAREAEGHGLRGDTSAAQTALGRAEGELTDAGDDGDAWFAYFGAPNLAAMTAQTFLSLGQPVAAERAASDSVTNTLARRPRALHCVSHARTLAACGRLDQAASVTVQAVDLGRGVSSQRMRADLASLRPALEGHESVRGVPEALAALASA